MYGCQQNLIHPDNNIKAILEFICSEANKLANCAIYYCRQMFFKARRYVTKYEVDSILKNNPHFKAMRSAFAQQICHDVVESFTSYKRFSKLWKNGRLANKPRLPKYRKKRGMSVVSCPARWIKLVDGMLKIPLGKQVKAWFGLDHFLLPMPSNLDFKSIKEFRIVPRNNCFYLECVYKQSDVKKVNPNLSDEGSQGQQEQTLISTAIEMAEHLINKVELVMLKLPSLIFTIRFTIRRNINFIF